MLEIRNALLAEGCIRNIQIKEGKIAGISSEPVYEEGEIFDVRGCYVLPGLVNLHVHFRVPGQSHKETLATGTEAALRGGATTVAMMPNTRPPIADQKSLSIIEGIIRDFQSKNPRAINYQLWFGATADNSHLFKEVARHPMVVGVKLFMSSAEGALLVKEVKLLRKIFASCAEAGLPLAVHAENEWRIQANLKRWDYPILVNDHSFIRDPKAETAAVRLALKLQKETGCRLYLCHLSLVESIELARIAKENGQDVWVEVCPHHLFISQHRLTGHKGELYKINPPIRDARQVLNLQEYVLRKDVVDVIASDHAPHLMEEKLHMRYRKIPSGVPGLQELCPLVFNWVCEGKMEPERFVALTSGNPAILARLGSKGRLALGCDADLVIIDPAATTAFRNIDMASKCGWTAYKGMKAVSKVVATIVKGKINYP